MALKNLFDMAKADKYTADGREALIKAQEAETEDKVYQIGEISQKTGLQKTANGWVKPKNGKQPGTKENGPLSPAKRKAERIAKMQKETGKAAPYGRTLKGTPKTPDDNPLTERTQKRAEGSKPGRDIPALKKEDHVKLAKEVLSNTSATDPGWTAEEIAKEWKLGKADAEEVKKEFDNLRKGSSGSKPAAANKTTIRQGPNTKTLNETPAEHVQKNLDAYTGYSPYDMEELVLKPSGYEKSRSTKGPDGVSSITYKKDGGDDIILFFDKYGELKNAGTSQNREGVMQKMRAAEGYGHMKVVGDYDVYRVTSGPDKGKYKVSKVGSLREVTMSEEKAADFLTSAAGKNKAANKDSAPSLSEIVDRVYNIGEISEKTGLQKTAQGWRPVKKGAAGKTSRASKEEAIRKDLGLTAGEDMSRFSDEQIEKMYAKTQQTPEQQKADFDKSKIGQAVNKGRQEFAAEKTRQKELASKTNAIGLPKESNLSDIPDFKGMESGDYDNKLRAEGWTTGGWEGNGTHASAIFKKGDRTIRVNEGQPGKITSVQEISKPAVEKFDIEKWKTGPKVEKNSKLDWSHGVVGESIPVQGKSAEEKRNLINKYNSVGRLSRIGTKKNSYYNNKHGTFEVAGIDNDNVYIQEERSNGMGSRYMALVTIPLNEVEEINPFHDYGKRNPETGEESPTRPPLPEDAAPRVLTGDCRIRIRKEKPALTGDTKIRVRK